MKILSNTNTNKDVTAKNQIISEAANGTPPLVVSSATLVPNLNADKLDGKDASAFAPKENGVFYVEGNTTGTAGTWTGTISDITELYTGLSIDYKIRIAGASTTTLNINSYGAKTVRRNNGNLTTHLPTGTVVHLTYDGTYWVWADYDSGNDTYQLRWENTFTVGRVVTSDAAMNYGTQGYHLMMEGVDGKLYAVTSGGNSASTTNKVTDAVLKVGGKILYYNTSTDIATNGNASSMFEGFYSTEMEYWSNKPSGWAVAYRPFYIVATKNASGHFELLDKGTVSSAFITQTLPSTDDGRYYIQIGYMNNTYDAWRLQTDHPIYEYKDGQLRQFVPYHTQSLGSITTTAGAGNIIISSGSVLTHTDGLNASKITAGTLATARLGSGTASSSTYLRGDQTWATLPADTNNYLTGISGSGNGTVTFARQGLTSLTWNASHTHDYLSSIDDRDIKPNNLSFNRVQTYFTSLEGLTGTAGEDYQDLLVLNSYIDASGGKANALAFDKSEMKIRYYQALQSATSWGTPKTLAFSEDTVNLTGNQTIAGTKTFSSTISGSISGNAGTVSNGVYTSGNQTIEGTKTFTSTIAGSISGNAGTVTNGVYTTGNQNIGGVKTFTSTISGTTSGNLTSSSNLNAAKLTGTIPADVAQAEWDSAYAWGNHASAGYLSSSSGLSASKLTGTIPTGVLGNSTVYIGTTAVALNRASAPLTLSGVANTNWDAAYSHSIATNNPHGLTLATFGITSTAAALNALDGITATVTELNYTDGVTSNIQTQLNGKANDNEVVKLTTSGATIQEIVSCIDISNESIPFYSTRKTSAGTGLYAAAIFTRDITTGTPGDNNGPGLYFRATNSAREINDAGVIGARLTVATQGATVGEIVLGPAWNGADPYNRTDFRVRARSASIADAYINGKFYSENTKEVATQDWVTSNTRSSSWTPTAGEISDMGTIGKKVFQAGTFDFDSFDIPTGIYAFNNVHPNNPPSGNYGTIIQTQYRVGVGWRYGIQIAFHDDTDRMFTRRTGSAGNSPWKEILYDYSISSWAKKSSLAIGDIPTGTTGSTVALGNHTHSQYLTSFTETDPTVPAHVKGITSEDISSWNGKQNAITGAATTITSSNLTTNRALISNGSGKVAVSAVTSTELGYLDGVTSSIQTQLNGKQATITGAVSGLVSTDLTAWKVCTTNGSGKIVADAVNQADLANISGSSGNFQTQINAKTKTTLNSSAITQVAYTVSGNTLTITLTP